MVKLAGFGKFIELTYSDTFSAYRTQSIQNADGSTSVETNVAVPSIQNQSCRISFKNADSSADMTEDSNPLRRTITVFCSVDLDVEKGDLIVASKYSDSGELLQTYTGYSNLPSLYVTHQEILLQEVGDA